MKVLQKYHISEATATIKGKDPVKVRCVSTKVLREILQDYIATVKNIVSSKEFQNLEVGLIWSKLNIKDRFAVLLEKEVAR